MRKDPSTNPLSRSDGHSSGDGKLPVSNGGDISRRAFVKKGGSLLIVTSVAACGDGGPVPTTFGTFRLVLTGLHPSATSGGAATATPTAGGNTITIDIPAAGDQAAAAPAGVYTVAYTPPPNHTLASGQTVPPTVTITEGQTTTVEIALVSSGSIQVTVTGLSGAPNGGSASALRTDVAGAAPVPINISAAGSGSGNVPPGTYSVTYTPPAGFAVSGQNPVTGVVVAIGAAAPVVFSVAATTQIGGVHVTVTGLTGAPSGGSVSARLTNNTGPTFNANLSAPSSGTSTGDLTGMPVGNYNITYASPGGYRLQAGQVNPKVATVTNGGTANTSFAAEPSPQGSGIVFNSDWSTALGTTDGALRDTGKSLPWDLIGGNGSLNIIVAATPALDFPGMTNLFKNIAEFGGGSQNVQTDQLRLTHTLNHIPIPAVGQSLFYRWYQRYVVPDSIDPAGGVPHSVQDGPAASQQNWMWETPINTNGTFNPQFNFANANPFPNNRWLSPPLNKNQTYRIEFQIFRNTATTFIPHCKIFNSVGTQVQSDVNFENRNGQLTFADNTPMNIENVAFLGGWQMGNNGPSWQNTVAGQYPFDLWYFGGAAVRTDDWCGEYAGGV